MFLTRQEGGGEGLGVFGRREASSMFVILNVRQKPEKSSHTDVF